MSHLIHIVLWPLADTLILFCVAYAAGNFLLRVITQKAGGGRALFAEFSLSALIGYALLSYATLIMSAFGKLNPAMGWLLVGAILVAGRRSLFRLYREHALPGWQAFKKWPLTNQLLAGVIALLVLFYLTSAFAPPYRNDALAYHLPEAMSIAERGVHFPVGHSQFFGSLPLLMETLYALLYTLGGFTTIHLTHYAILLCALWLMGGFIKEKFNARAALLGSIFVFSLYELLVDATNAYVDAATVSFELSGLFVLFYWTKNQNNRWLGVAGLLFGFAAAVKYNALYGILIASALVLFYVLKSRSPLKSQAQALLVFVAALGAGCGFWYVKNLILYHNPMYPFYFGHVGFSDAAYADLTNTIKLFRVARTPLNFILLPFYFFLESYYIVIFAAYLTWPLLLAARRWSAEQRWFLKISSAYVGLYALIWFFFGTHQIRFFLAPLVLLLLLFGVHLDYYVTTLAPYARRWPAIRVIAVAAVLVALLAGGAKIARAKNNYFVSVKKVDWYYLTGRYTAENFYRTKKLGTAYDLSQYVNKQYHDTVFLNLWSTPDFFLTNGNRFISPEDFYYRAGTATGTLPSYLAQNKINYVVIDENERYQSFHEPVRVNNPSYLSYRDFVVTLEPVVQRLVPVYEQADFAIYRLNNP